MVILLGCFSIDYISSEGVEHVTDTVNVNVFNIAEWEDFS